MHYARAENVPLCSSKGKALFMLNNHSVKPPTICVIGGRVYIGQHIVCSFKKPFILPHVFYVGGTD